MSKKVFPGLFVASALTLAALALYCFPRAGGAATKGKVAGRIAERGSRLPLAAEVGVSVLSDGKLTFRHVVADARGEFQLEGLEAGQAHLSTKLDGYTVEHHSLTIAPGDSAAVEFELSKVKLVRGAVRDAAGKPVPDADVRVVYPTEAPARGVVKTSFQWEAGDAQSDEAGNYVIKVHPEKEFVVEATHPDQLGAVSAPVKLKPSEGEVTVNLSFGKGVSVAGTVRDERGQAVPGVQVMLVETGRDRANPRFASHELLRQRARFAASGADGAFRVEQVTPTKKLLVVKHPGFETFRHPLDPAKQGKKAVAVVLKRAR
jgi:hypothetical protein